MADQPLRNIRILSMEQVVALPFATRHLADLGAEVIRVQSHQRFTGTGASGSLFRNKQLVGLDLTALHGPELFLQLAANCDVVAHNFTPRVMRKFGIDYEGVKAVNKRVIYCSVSGYGTTGPWSDRPLFGPGAEALSGQNLMIGEPDALTPGRPGTVTYADSICGLNLVFALLAALEHRDLSGYGQHIDISLYETNVCHIGTTVAESAFGAPLPERIGNQDKTMRLHGVFETRGHDRHITLAATTAQIPGLLNILEIDKLSDLTKTLKSACAKDMVEKLQQAGIAAAVVQDPSDISSDVHLWSRGYFGHYQEDAERTPQFGPAWGGGRDLSMSAPRRLGADNRRVLADIAGLDDAAIDALYQSGTIGEVQQEARLPLASPAQRIERGELSRFDNRYDDWKSVKEKTA
jgi:crotonobetainyl-CoA:carnitine CoA-transferase CaiB-like acyl-CoA transferase